MGSKMGMVYTLWRTLGSTWLAAVLLAAFLLAVLLGSLFPQMPSDPAAQEAWLSAVSIRYRHVTHLLHTVGLFKLYHTPWFHILLTILSLSTVLCAIQRFPLLRHALTRPSATLRPEGFYDTLPHHAAWRVLSLDSGLTTVQEALRRYRYFFAMVRDPAGDHVDLYAEQGRWGQAGTVLSHVAATLLVIALVLRPFLAWQDQDVILVPEQIHPVGHGHDWAVQTGALTVDRHPGGEPRQYQVPLTLLIEGLPTRTYLVRINHPLTFHRVSFHLQGYGPAVEVAAPDRTSYLAFVGDQSQEMTVPGSNVRLRVALMPNDQALYIEAVAAGGAVIGSGPIADGEQITVQGIPLTFHIDQYTLWQVSHDPTFGWAVASGALFLTCVIMSLWVPHRRLWLRIEAGQVRLASFEPGALDLFLAETLSAHLLGEEPHG